MVFGRLRIFSKSLFCISAVLAGLISFASLIPDAWSAGFGNLRLSYIQGDVQVRTGDTQDWVAAATNIPLADGDNIWSPERSAAEVQALNGTCVRIAENSSLSVVMFDRNTGQFSLDQGNAYVNSRGGKNELFQLDTPSASIRVIGKAIFEADVSTEGYTDVSVLAGSLSVESESGAVTVSQGQVLSIKQGGAPRLFALSPPDDWTRWNQDRDRVIYQQRASARYLPPDLQTYSYDLDQNGQWTNTPDYGYVWTPTVVVGAAWSPYRVGRWCWMRGDYVWVPNEPWGWAPYHYGRWAWHRLSRLVLGATAPESCFLGAGLRGMGPNTGSCSLGAPGAGRDILWPGLSWAEQRQHNENQHQYCHHKQDLSERQRSGRSGSNNARNLSYRQRRTRSAERESFCHPQGQCGAASH